MTLDKAKFQLAEQLYIESHEECPNLRFKTGLVDLGSSIRFITDLISLKLPNELDRDGNIPIIISQVFRQYQEFRDTPEYSEYFRSIDTLISNITESVTNVFNILKFSVKPEVDGLKELILKRYEERSSDARDSIYLFKEETVSAMNFKLLNWDYYLNILGGYDIISSYFKEQTGMEFQVHERIINTLQQVVGYSIPTLEFDEVTLADIIARWKAAIAEHTTSNTEDLTAPATIEQLIRFVVNRYEFDYLQKSILGAINNNDAEVAIQTLTTNIETYYPLLLILPKVPINVTDEMMAAIVSNIETMKNLMLFCGVALVSLREHFKESYLLTTNQVNGDTQDEFESKGGTSELLSKFVYLNHIAPNIAIPYYGVSVEAILSQKENTEKLFNEKKLASIAKFNSDKMFGIVAAAREILEEHLANTDETRLPKDMSLEEFTKYHANTVNTYLNLIDTSEGNHLESMLYEFVVNLWYDGTMVQTAHKLFGTLLIKQLEASQELDSAAMSLIDVRVASILASRFVFNELCE